MKYFIVLALVAAAAADVSHIVRHADADAQIVKQDSDVFPDQYQYSYESSNGIAGQESGVLKNVGRGSNSYISPEGEHIQLSYVADENGYQPQGSHLPTPPPPQPIPDYIIRSLEYIAAHPPAPEPARRA
ncbi:hypothetical protein O3G_MSEX001399 [Manduca sexta]|uniref:Pupal cuticle protein Edg-78E n=1 Tax=Manduca sexta TaxID=7130 RepID=A0A921YJX7_MANSE|nr:hypothetical protein O3G_MSEX001399 [Manduca sexta]